MWTPLRHPRQVQFYEEFHSGRQKADADWMPMVRAVQHLQSLGVAPYLFAFTSLWRFHLTTAPTYQECGEHCSVTIIWRFTDKRFEIAFGRLAGGWVDDRRPEQICNESAFPVVIEPFIQRLWASFPSVEAGTRHGDLAAELLPDPNYQKLLGKDEIRCFQCFSVIKAGADACPKCGWTWK